MKTKRIPLVISVLVLALSAPAVRAQTTLANALNATNLVWTTGGTGGVGWTYHAGTGAGSDTFDGIASAQSGHIGDSSETWMQTTVVGPGTITFWWSAYSEPNADWLEFYINTAEQARICGGGDDWSTWASGWEYCSFPVPAGTNVLEWRYAKDGDGSTGGTLDCGWVDQVSYFTSPPPPLQLALNTCGVVWNSSGSVYTNGWFAQTNATHDGKWAAQSGAITHGQTNWLQATVSGVTNVSFWWKVSSQTNADYLQFFTNGVLAKQISGEVNWQSNYFKLPLKTNTLTWLYMKDPMITAGSNCGWLDQVAFSPAIKAFPYALQGLVRLPDGRMQMVVNGECGCPCEVQFATNSMIRANWSLLTNLTTSAANTAIIDSAASNSPMRFYRAVSP